MLESVAVLGHYLCKDRKVNIRNKEERDEHENDNVCRSLC